MPYYLDAVYVVYLILSFKNRFSSAACGEKVLFFFCKQHWIVYMTQLPAEFRFCVKLIILWGQNDFTTAVLYTSAGHYTTEMQISLSLYQTSV